MMNIQFGEATVAAQAVWECPLDMPRERILLVDDSRIVRRIFSRYLSPMFECEEAGSFDEALSNLKNGDFAVVITDMIMPGLSGIELLRKVKEQFPNTEVIVVSGVQRSERVLEAFRLGAFDYLIKPCDAEVLKFTVERALAHRLLTSANRQNSIRQVQRILEEDIT